MALLRAHPALRTCVRHQDLATLRNGRFVRIAGLVTGRQRPGTASGVIFLTLEDETGNTNVIVWRDLQTRLRAALLNARLLLVKGVLEQRHDVCHVIAGELIDHSALLPGLAVPSRDFH
jgi:error-prone DNA polymerase